MKATSGGGGDGLVPVIKPNVAANRGRGRPRPVHELALSPRGQDAIKAVTEGR